MIFGRPRVFIGVDTARGREWKTIGTHDGGIVIERREQPAGSDHVGHVHVSSLPIDVKLSSRTFRNLRRLIYAPLWPNEPTPAERVRAMQAWSRRRGRTKGRAS